MKTIYAIHYTDGFGCHSIDFESDIQKAKRCKESHEKGSLAKYNRFVPIEVVTTEERFLHLWETDVEKECCNVAAYMQESLWPEDFARAYIYNKFPGYEIIKKKYAIQMKGE